MRPKQRLVRRLLIVLGRKTELRTLKQWKWSKENKSERELRDRISQSKKCRAGDFPGSPVVKTSPTNAGDAGLIPAPEAKIPHASWPNNQNTHKKEAIL